MLNAIGWLDSMFRHSRSVSASPAVLASTVTRSRV
jgi:hypothetical protein